LDKLREEGGWAYWNKKYLGFWFETVAAHYIADSLLNIGFDVDIQTEQVEQFLTTAPPSP
jgi:hypothetical protein